MKSITKLIAMAASAILITTTSSIAEGVRVRGELTSIEGNQFVVTSSSGQSTSVAMDEPLALVYSNLSIEDIALDSYVSVPTVQQDTNVRRALGLSVFPDAMRGMNEGFADWDITAESKMTNATVAKVITRGGERSLTLQYGDEEQVVIVPETAPITTFAPNPEYEFSKGDLVVVFAEETAGKYSGKFVAVHEDGSLPPL